MRYLIGILVLMSTFLSAYEAEVIPVGKNKFVLKSENGSKDVIDMDGQDFILISVRESGADGRFYAVDRDGTVWLSSAVTSGIDMLTPSGKWAVVLKKRYHMSSKYPDEDGINNMDYSIFFTKAGHALHQGSMTGMSHGCIHVHKKVIPSLFNWAHEGMPVFVTRHSFMPYAQDDLMKIYHYKSSIRRSEDDRMRAYNR